jgi:hypothetical protein
VIYRGLAAVTVGGVALSLLFTIVLVPALLRLASTRSDTASAALDVVYMPVRALR